MLAALDFGVVGMWRPRPGIKRPLRKAVFGISKDCEDGLFDAPDSRTMDWTSQPDFRCNCSALEAFAGESARKEYGKSGI